MKPMVLVTQVKLTPSPEQAQALLETLDVVNAAANWLSSKAFESKVFSRIGLQKKHYYELRETFPVSAQIACLLIRKVSDAYRKDKKVQRVFRSRGSIAFDPRILSWNYRNQMVSIWTVRFGRILIPYQAGPLQLERLRSRAGESDLVFRGGRFFLNATCTVQTPDLQEVHGFLGVDLGVNNIATTSDRKRVTSEAIEANRIWYHGRRQRLQSVGTKSSKRRLKSLAGRQSRFQRDVNHRISNELIAEAKRTNRALVLEDLTGIPKDRAQKPNRGRRNNWSFFQLRNFIQYKAQVHGVNVVLVNPAYTSQRCGRCGHTEKANRKNQAEFQCCACHHEAHADYNAAVNIRNLGSEVFMGSSQRPHGGNQHAVNRKPLPKGRGG